jgi:hypothetical protein
MTSSSYDVGSSVLYPQANGQISEKLYLIEVALRELIIESLTTAFGPKWLKQQLPGGGEVQKQLKDARAYERATPWSDYIPHHPVYYLDFPLLRQTIERHDNWEAAFRPIFGRKDLVTAVLAGLEPIRNKVAHNRMATGRDLTIVEGSYVSIVNTLEAARGVGALKELVLRGTSSADLPTQLKALGAEASNARAIVAGLEWLDKLPTWRSVRAQWWFDEDYLGADLTPIISYFTQLEDYASYPRVRGEGYKIEAFVKEREILTLAANAGDVLTSLTRAFT